MADYPKISIVTPSYNQGKYLEKTILSVLEQGYPNLEYIIIDGGSTDESAEIIRKYADRLTYWVSEPDRGQSHAINKGFARATGDILGWLNSDDLYTHGALHRVACLDWKNIDFCYGEGYWVDADGLILERYPTIPPTKLTLKHCCTLCQPSVFYSRATYNSLGPLSVEYKNSFDYEYWFRAISKTKRFKYICHVQAFSRMHYENKTLSDKHGVYSENQKLIAEYYKEDDKELLQAQVDVIVVEYSKMREKRLSRSLDMAYEGFSWKNRTVDGWVNGSAKAVFKEKPINEIKWYAELYVPPCNLPVSVFFYNMYVTKKYECVKSGYYLVPLNDIIANTSKFTKPYVKIYADKISSPSDYLNSNDTRELGVLVNIVKRDS